MAHTAGLVCRVQPQNTYFCMNIKESLTNVANSFFSLTALLKQLHYWNNWRLLVLPFQESVFQLWPLFPQSFLLFVPQFFLWCHQSLRLLQCVHSKQNFINKATFNERMRAQNKVVLIQISVRGPTTNPSFTALKRQGGSMLNWTNKLT